MEVEFAQWLAGVLSGQIHVEWRLSRQAFNMTSIEFAFCSYIWRGCNYAETSALLVSIQARTRSALRVGDQSELQNCVEEILRWGGVLNGNARWLRDTHEPSGLCAEIAGALTLALADRFDERRFAEGRYRSNAGLTKVYSLAADNFAIYDSRVAAALQMLVAMFLAEKNIVSIPPELAFAGMSYKAKTHRRASFKKVNFPMVWAANSTVHMRSNHLANRLLLGAIRAARGKPGADWCATDSMRRIEAALFMVGYDLPEQFRSV